MNTNLKEKIHAKSDNIKVKTNNGKWYVIDTNFYWDENRTLYLIEHQTYGDETEHLIIDEDGEVVQGDVWNGFDDYDYVREEFFEGCKFERNLMSADLSECDLEHDVAFNLEVDSLEIAVAIGRDGKGNSPQYLYYIGSDKENDLHLEGGDVDENIEHTEFLKMTEVDMKIEMLRVLDVFKNAWTEK